MSKKTITEGQLTFSNKKRIGIYFYSVFKLVLSVFDIGYVATTI